MEPGCEQYCELDEVEQTRPPAATTRRGDGIACEGNPAPYDREPVFAGPQPTEPPATEPRTTEPPARETPPIEAPANEAPPTTVEERCPSPAPTTACCRPARPCWWPAWRVDFALFTVGGPNGRRAGPGGTRHRRMPDALGTRARRLSRDRRHDVPGLECRSKWAPPVLRRGPQQLCECCERSWGSRQASTSGTSA
jgi:hypothetical protein